MKTLVSPKLRLNGFALVVTLALMILLTVIAVGLLSLSAISLRSSSQTMAQGEARANARLALMLALGDLQKTMGPDRRVSANSAIVSSPLSKTRIGPEYGIRGRRERPNPATILRASTA